ncbi:family 10 glycosylhydrolase, partial [Haemophilus parainfluenzae]
MAATVRAKRPQAIFSVSPNPPEFSYDNFLQDWPAWIAAAGVDEIVIQLYRWNLPNFLSELQKNAPQPWRQQVPVSFGVLSGL